MPTQIRLPDLLADWPIAPIPNPYHDTVAAASSKWVESYHAMDEKTQAAFNRCEFSYFTARAFPRADPASFRAACDLLNYYFVFEEMSDYASGAEVREQSKVIMEALRDPSKPRPLGESLLGEMARSFWSKALKFTSPSSAQRFLRHFSAFTESIAQEAEDREQGRIRNIQDYLELRRGTIGTRPSFNFSILAEDLPDEILAHPHIEGLVHRAIDMTIIGNDIYSYNKEQACGADTHNLVAVVMREKGLDVQGSFDYIGDLYRDLSQKFVHDTQNLPSFGEPIDQVLSEYVAGLGSWVTANIDWCFETVRYFGGKGREVQANLVFELRPKVVGA